MKYLIIGFTVTFFTIFPLVWWAVIVYLACLSLMTCDLNKLVAAVKG